MLHTLGLESGRHETAHLLCFAISFFDNRTLFVLFGSLESTLSLDESIARLVVIRLNLAVQKNCIKLIRSLRF